MQTDNKEGEGELTSINTGAHSRGSAGSLSQAAGPKSLMFFRSILFHDPNEAKVFHNLHLSMLKIPLKF